MGDGIRRNALGGTVAAMAFNGVATVEKTNYTSNGDDLLLMGVRDDGYIAWSKALNISTNEHIRSLTCDKMGNAYALSFEEQGANIRKFDRAGIVTMNARVKGLNGWLNDIRLGPGGTIFTTGVSATTNELRVFTAAFREAITNQPRMTGPSKRLGGFGFTIEAKTRGLYAIESSPDFRQWSRVLLMDIEEPTAAVSLPITSPSQFFRIVSP